MAANSLHIAMYPWFAMGHLTPFLHLANKLAEKGHRISFLIPPKAESKLSHFNLHPDLITFIPITFPHVDGLPLNAQLTSVVPYFKLTLIMTAMDRTQSEIESKLSELKPHFVFFDFSYWITEIARKLGIVSVHYCIINAASVAYLCVPSRWEEDDNKNSTNGSNFLEHQPKGFPSSAITLKKCEASAMHSFAESEFGLGTTFSERKKRSFSSCDAIAFKSCREMERKYCDYLGSQLGKPVLFTGPGLPSRPTDSLDLRWLKWLNKFEKQSVVYVAFGSEIKLKRAQFEELLLGLELMGRPFLAALKPPHGVETIEDAIPKGFQERVGERGVIYGGWVQQQLLLAHPSVGCFITHCGSGSLSEALVSDCQLVLLPSVGDQFVNARLMGGDLKVGVEVEKRSEDGWYTKENVLKAVNLVMDEESEIGSEVRANHSKWRDFLLAEGLESSYIDGFISDLHGMLG
ncbi:anthocyanidin 3-O-glucoside 2'''-O-xylosyltransferase [Ranunculus cassubicifolius]